jgi:tetratricopeptide (TPR) repeat protein
VPPDIQALLDRHDYAGAEQAVHARLASSPEWETGHLLLAQIYNTTGRHEMAERAGLAAMRLRESLDALMALAVADMNLRKLNESIAWLEKAAKRQPNDPEIYRVLGLDYALGGNMQESVKAFRHATQLAPENADLAYLEGRALYEIEKFPEARQALERAVERNPLSTRSWTALGQVYDRMGDTASAGRHYRKALEVCGSTQRECAWPQMELGFLASRHSGEKEAEQYFRRAVDARPDWAKPHFYLGKTLAASGNLAAALAELESAARLEPDQSQHHYQLAQVYRRLGKVKQSEQHLARYRELVETERNKKAPFELHEP